MKKQKKIIPKGVMHPNHEKWDEFLDNMLLWIFDCIQDDDTNKNTRVALQKIEGIDVKRSLEYFKDEFDASYDPEIISLIAEQHLPGILARIIIYRFNWINNNLKVWIDLGADPWEVMASISVFDTCGVLVSIGGLGSGAGGNC